MLENRTIALLTYGAVRFQGISLLDLKTRGWIPSRAKSHELCDGLLMCGNHHLLFDGYALSIRFFPDARFIRLFFEPSVHRKRVRKFMLVNNSSHPTSTAKLSPLTLRIAVHCCLPYSSSTRCTFVPSSSTIRSCPMTALGKIGSCHMAYFTLHQVLLYMTAHRTTAVTASLHNHNPSFSL